MSNGDEMKGSGSIGAEVVRLKIDGATAVVNTLRDQSTARGMSLVCPFPALEVEIPVRLGRGEGAMTQGTIHRIGVEDDPESGLPRLRLSVRTPDTRSTIVGSPSDSLLDEAGRLARGAVANAETDLDVLSDTGFESDPAEGMVDAEKTDPEIARPPLDAAAPAEEENVVRIAPDPEWAGCGEIALPDRLRERERSRRRRRLSGFAAWAFIFGTAAGGVYVLGKAKVVDFDSVRDAISGFHMSKVASVEEARLDPIAFVDSTASGSVQAVAGDTAGASTGWETHAEAAEEPAVEPVGGAPVVEAPVGGAPVVEASVVEAPVVEASAVEEEDTIVLPTRWPAEYANAYRLRDPNGVVVDVPGALVTREGWLEVGEHRMVRSVKAMQRETGARFVVYIEGELPRFMTAPRTTGIALKLIRDAAAPAPGTQQVAALDK